MDDEPVATTPTQDGAKPWELLCLAEVAAELFTRLQAWFDVPESITIPLDRVDGPTVTADLQDGQKVAAFAMRKLQALHLTAQPGVPTKPDVPLNLIESVLRSLIEAPNRRLTFELANTDWDRESRLLDAGLVWRRPPPASELPRFEALLGQLQRSREALIDLLEAGNRVVA